MAEVDPATEGLRVANTIRGLRLSWFAKAVEKFRASLLLRSVDAQPQ